MGGLTTPRIARLRTVGTTTSTTSTLQQRSAHCHSSHPRVCSSRPWRCRAWAETESEPPRCGRRAWRGWEKTTCRPVCESNEANDPSTKCAKALAKEPGSDLETVTKVVPSPAGDHDDCRCAHLSVDQVFFRTGLFHFVHVPVHLVDQPTKCAEELEEDPGIHFEPSERPSHGARQGSGGRVRKRTGDRRERPVLSDLETEANDQHGIDLALGRNQQLSRDGAAP